jgi:hypothetical protein
MTMILLSLRRLCPASQAVKLPGVLAAVQRGARRSALETLYWRAGGSCRQSGLAAS